MEMNIAVIPGDGIGPEITTAAIIVLEAIAEKYGHVLNLQYVKACSQSVEESGEPLPKEALNRGYSGKGKTNKQKSSIHAGLRRDGSLKAEHK